MFVNGNLETVSDDKGNTFWVKAKMDIATESAVAADIMRIGGVGIIALQLQSFCLLRRNLKAWDGPDFLDEKGKAIPCTLAMIDKLDPAEQIVKDAIEKIAELNTKKTAEVTPEETAANPTPAANVT